MARPCSLCAFRGGVGGRVPPQELDFLYVLCADVAGFVIVENFDPSIFFADDFDFGPVWEGTDFFVVGGRSFSDVECGGGDGGTWGVEVGIATADVAGFSLEVDGKPVITDAGDTDGCATMELSHARFFGGRCFADVEDVAGDFGLHAIDAHVETGRAGIVGGVGFGGGRHLGAGGILDLGKQIVEQEAHGVFLLCVVKVWAPPPDGDPMRGALSRTVLRRRGGDEALVWVNAQKKKRRVSAAGG